MPTDLEMARANDARAERWKKVAGNLYDALEGLGTRPNFIRAIVFAEPEHQMPDGADWLARAFAAMGDYDQVRILEEEP